MAGSGRPDKRKPKRHQGQGAPRPRQGPPAGGYWLFGRHAVEAALANPARRTRRFLATSQPDEGLTALLDTHKQAPPQVVDRSALDAVLPEGAVHQGLALECHPLRQPALPTLIDDLGEAPATLVALDQVTDPHNVGAILRSAAAFGAAALLTTQDRAPEEGGTLAKSASGALEIVPYLRETNLVRALERLQKAGFWCLGLDETGVPLAEVPRSERLVLVMGAEGAGLRRLTKERCDHLCRLPTRPPLGTLNVSNAAAVALYELCGRNSA
ncbi:MAG: 23S rRNA (guanosine(2251)-2'-O)-methyltransferase RlmB [Pseudomonadota bacterium]